MFLNERKPTFPSLKVPTGCAFCLKSHTKLSIKKKRVTYLMYFPIKTDDIQKIPNKQKRKEKKIYNKTTFLKIKTVP